MQLLIPMAGAGSRFTAEGYTLPKPLIPVDGKPMIQAVVEYLPKTDKQFFVLREEHVQELQIDKEIQKIFPHAKTVIDPDPIGQATSCMAARAVLDPSDSLLIGACDNGQLWDQSSWDELVAGDLDAVLFTFRNNATVSWNPNAYGWVKMDENGNFDHMSVKIPISDTPMNDHAVVGTFWFRKAQHFFDATDKMVAENDKINGEFYVDKVFDHCKALGQKVGVFEVDKYICWGTPNDLKTYNYWKEVFVK